MTRDRSTGLIALVLGIAVAVAAMQLPKSTMAGDVGPKVFPFISAACLIICGLGLIVTGGKKSGAAFTVQQIKRLAIISAVVLGYAVLMNFAGFIIPSIAILFVLSTMFSEGKKTHFWHRLIFAVAVTMALYFSFTALLGLKLPVSKLF